jgi:hypothetical protein
MILSVTRLRLRPWYLLPLFFLHMSASIAQVRNAPGFVDGKLLADRQLTFWTLTRWKYEAGIIAWARSGAHSRAMSHLAAWCDEASVVRWEPQGASALPPWDECHRRLAADGRRSAVDHPSVEQKAGLIRPPQADRVWLEWTLARKPDRRA